MARVRGDGQRGRGERGVALVEFALLLPFVALLVFGTIDLGRGFNQQNRLKNASREGAAYAQLHPTRWDCPGVNNDIADAVKAEDAGLTGLTVTVSGTHVANDCASPAAAANIPAENSTLTVQVKANFNVLTPFVSAITGNPLVQKAETKVQVQS